MLKYFGIEIKLSLEEIKNFIYQYINIIIYII